MVLAMVTPHRSLPVGLESCGLRETSCLKPHEVWRPQSHACLWPPRRAVPGDCWALPKGLRSHRRDGHVGRLKYSKKGRRRFAVT